MSDLWPERLVLNNQQILTKAIEKAIAGGWTCFNYATLHNNHKGNYEVDYDTGHLRLSFWNIGKTREYDSVDFEISEYEIIFNQEFAKALWGVEWPDGPGGRGYIGEPTPRWHHFLQEMVIADDPIKYLGENL